MYSELLVRFAVFTVLDVFVVLVGNISAAHGPLLFLTVFGLRAKDNGVRVCVSTLSLALYVSGVAIKTLYLHPLAKYPGPKLWALTRLPYVWAFRSGTLAHRIKEFHEQYGPVVRVAADEVSFTDPEASRDIYNRRSASQQFKVLPKDPVRIPPPTSGGPVNLLAANDADHARIRKSVSHSFSPQALAAQEGLVKGYIDKFINHLKAHASTGKAVDLDEWLGFCIFDVICSLSLGEDFGCLEEEKYHEWVGMIANSIVNIVQIAACRYYPWLFELLLKTIPRSAHEQQAKHGAITREKVSKRMQRQVDRPDFLQRLQASKDGLSDEEIVVNLDVFIRAGSHTTQTAIIGILFRLLQNPQSLSRVAREVRDEFANDKDIKMVKLQQLPLLSAAIQEGLRLTSPVALGLTRLVPPGGATIGGDFFSAGTTVSYMPWAANVSPRNFTSPDDFALERWLDVEKHPGANKYADDRKDALQPFSQGPRNCIGQNLANMEMHLIIARLLFNFEMDVVGGAQMLGKWEEQESYTLWLSKPLRVTLRARV